jgi:hypothetical protein
VHPEFKCVVLIDEQDVGNQDPPFLNRFEKQLLNFQSELSEDEMKIARNIDDSLASALYPPNHPQLLLRLNKVLFNYQVEEIYAIIYMMRSLGENAKKFEECYEKILRLATGDFLMAIDLRESVPDHDKDTLTFIRELYFRNNHESLAEYLRHNVRYINSS